MTEYLVTFTISMDDVDLVFESRGKVAAKCKGEMEVYFESMFEVKKLPVIRKP